MKLSKIIISAVCLALLAGCNWWGEGSKEWRYKGASNDIALGQTAQSIQVGILSMR